MLFCVLNQVCFCGLERAQLKFLLFYDTILLLMHLNYDYASIAFTLKSFQAGVKPKS